MDQLIVARTAAEEIDHYRKVARVAGDIGVDVSFVLSQPNEKRFVDTFRGSITTWEDNSVFGFLIDRVGRYQLEEFYDCSYLPLQRILPDIVTEELGHIEYGYNKTLELIQSGVGGKAKAQRAVDYLVCARTRYVWPLEFKEVRTLSPLGFKAPHQPTGARRLYK